MSEILYGCKAIKFGVASDAGVMPTTMTKLFDTYRDTVSFVEEEPDVVDEYSDQSDTPITVSYTHLDVYKRQIQRECGCRSG